MIRLRLRLAAVVFGLVAVGLLATDTSVQAVGNSSQLSVVNFFTTAPGGHQSRHISSD